MGCEPGVSTGGIRCPQCFVQRAWNKGLTDVNWSLIPIPKGFSVKVPLEGRVTLRYHYYKGEPRELMHQWYASFIDTHGHWQQWPSELTDFAGATTWRDGVTRHQVRGLDLLALVALAIPVIHRLGFRRLRPVILRHFDSSDGLLSRTLYRPNVSRSGLE